MKSFSAIVAGSTGAVGRELVAQLVANPSCTKVVALTRRPVSDVAAAFPSISGDASKLQTVQVDWDTIESQAALFADMTVAFSCLGSSRWFPEVRSKLEAASTEEEKDQIFVEVLNTIDKKYMLAFGKLAMDAGVKHFQEVSARGADSSVTGGGFRVYHRVKGEADDAARAQLTKFPNGISIMRPGFLGRGSLSQLRPNEVKWEEEGRVGIPVGVVAKGMLAEFSNRMAQEDSSPRNVDEAEIAKLAGWEDTRQKL